MKEIGQNLQMTIYFMEGNSSKFPLAGVNNNLIVTKTVTLVVIVNLIVIYMY